MSRDFPGSGTNLLNAANPALFQIGGDITACCWWHCDTVTSAAGRLLGKWSDVAGGNSYLLDISSSKARWFGNDGSTQFQIVGGTTLVNGRWYHHLGRKQGTGANSLQLFLNGILDGQMTQGTNNQAGSAALTIGNSAANAGPFDGRIAEAAVWNVALSNAEIAALAAGVSPAYFRRSNLVFYVPIYGAGAPEADLSGNRNNGALTGSAPGFNHAPVGVFEG